MSLRKQVYIYFSTYFINAVFSFLTISILTHNLQAFDYGIINLYTAFISLLTPFITAGVLYPISIEYYKRTTADYQQFFTSAQVIPLLSLSFFTLLCIFFRQPLTEFLKVDPVWVIVLPMITWLIMNNETIMLLCRVKNKPWSFAFFSIGKNFTEIAITLGLILGLGWAWEGRLLAVGAAPFLLSFFSLYLFYRWRLITKKISWTQVQRIAWVSAPFIFERLSIFVLSNSDRYFIDKYDLGGTSQVGIYSVGAQIAAIVLLVILSMNSAYQPYIFQHLAAGNRDKLKKATRAFIGASILILGIIFLTTPLLFRFFIGDGFEGARIFVYYLSGGYFMWAIYNAFLPYLLFLGKNRLIFYMSLAGMLISLILNFILVPGYGALGAAISSIATYTVMMLICIKFAWKYYTGHSNPITDPGSPVS